MKKLLSTLLLFTLLAQSAVAFADTVPTESPSEAASENTEVVTATATPSAEASEEPTAEATDEPTEKPTETPDTRPSSNKVTLNVIIDDVPNIDADSACFELYDYDGNFLDSKTLSYTQSTHELNYTFDVPSYSIGEYFRIKCTSGFGSVKYCTDSFAQGSEILFPTYVYSSESGDTLISDGISISATPNFSKTLNISYDGSKLNLYPAAKLIDGVTMIPIRQVAEHIGFTVKYNSDYDVEIVSLGSNSIYFNVGTVYTTVFGKDINASSPTVKINDTIYVSLRTFADAIGSTLSVVDNFTSLDINMQPSSYYSNYITSTPVNKWGIASRTSYMVWISKSEYMVRVYKGSQYKWELVYEAPCAIGAPGTPTITGSFEYQYKTQWNYNGYYVGPCLVFYGGYALHSVLLRYDNTEYDGRTGVQISHGCIRLKKKDIDWISNTIPLYTRIYVTE